MQFKNLGSSPRLSREAETHVLTAAACDTHTHSRYFSRGCCGPVCFEVADGIENLYCKTQASNFFDGRFLGEPRFFELVRRAAGELLCSGAGASGIRTRMNNNE